MHLTATTRPIALLGHPVEHSLSPAIHNAAFEATGQPFVYIAADVPEASLPAAVRGLATLGYRGANVTIPHKEAVAGLMDELTPQAAATGAVNTIICERSSGEVVHLIGDNTDVTGFVASLHPVMERVMNLPAVVLGSGGAARAVVYALATTLRASRITLVARSPERARRMLDEMRLGDMPMPRVVPWDDLSSALRSSRFVVNATPIGMHPRVDASPVAEAGDFSKDHLVYDLIYRPRRTRLLQEAADRGAEVIDGLEMLLGQAAASFARWTGIEMPIDVVRERVLFPEN